MNHTRRPGFGRGVLIGPHRRSEPGWQDGIDNGIDFDGGLSVWRVQVDQPDPQCIGRPWRNREGTECGLGYELAPLMPGCGASCPRVVRS
jgi:hypothetical protein